MIEYTAQILKCNEPSVTGKIYLKDEVEKAIAVYMKKDNLGELGSDYNPAWVNAPPLMSINLDQVSHKIIDTYVDDDGWWCARIEVLETPMGKILTGLLEAGIEPRLTLRCVGIVGARTVISEIDIIAIDVADHV